MDLALPSTAVARTIVVSCEEEMRNWVPRKVQEEVAVVVVAAAVVVGSVDDVVVPPGH